MEIESLEALSPLDGRYARATRELARCFCEAALMKYRTLVEVEFLLALCGEPGVEAAPPAGREMRETLKRWCAEFTTADAGRIKEFEAVTNHDVKAVEYFLAEKLESTPWASYRPMIHFACTSEDINNLAYALMIKEALGEVILPRFARVLQDLEAKAVSWAAMPMLALTHGQPASPTTLGKEFRVFAERLRRQVHGIRRVEVLGKLNGARELTVDVIKEWFYYFYQCTECRRCSVFCPFGIDTAEITMFARELLGLLGLYINWAIEPVANCYRFGNHLAIPPHGLVDTLEFMLEDIEEARASTPAWATCCCFTSWVSTIRSARMLPRAGTSGSSPPTK